MSGLDFIVNSPPESHITQGLFDTPVLPQRQAAAQNGLPLQPNSRSAYQNDTLLSVIATDGKSNRKWLMEPAKCVWALLFPSEKQPLFSV